MRTDEARQTAADPAVRPDPAEARARRRLIVLGGLVVAVGVPLGLLAEWRTQAVIERAWSTCVGMSWTPTYALAPDGTRFGMFTWWFYLLVYAVGFPLGFLLVTGRVRGRVSARRIIAGCAAGLIVLAALSAADLAQNVAPKDGYYLSNHCPAGHPAWWPKWLPISDSGDARPMDLSDLG